MKKEVIVEKKIFKGKDGSEIEYLDISMDIAGNKLKLQFKDDDKKLAVYLLKNEL